MTFIPTKDAAPIVGRSIDTLRRWRVEGNGPKYTKIAGRVFYDAADLDAWNDAQRTKTATTSAYDDHNLVVGGANNDA